MLDRVIIKNISSLFSIRIAGYVIPLLTLPYLVRVLDPQGYGTFIYCVAISQYFIIAVNYGFDLSATKLIAEEKNDINKVSSLFWNVFSIRLTIALIGFLILFLVSFISEEINDLFSILSYCYISAIAAAFFPQWLFQGKEQLGVISIVRIVSQLMTIPFIFMLVKSENDINIVAFLTSLPCVVVAIFSSILIYKRQWLVFCKPSLKKMVEQIVNGWHVFISTAAISLYTTSTVVVLGITCGPASVGIYASANKLLQAAIGILTPLTASFYPRINSLLKDDEGKALDLIRYALKVLISITILMAFCIYFLSPFIVELLYGEKFSRSAVLLQLMSVLPLLVSLSSVFGLLVLLPFDLKKQYTKIYLFSGVLSLTMVTILSKYFDAEGAAVSMVLTEILVLTLMALVIRAKKIPVFNNSVSTQSS